MKKYYCSECKKKLENKNNAVCDKCGRPTTPVGFIQRFEEKNILDPEDKKLLKFIGMATLITSIISFCYSCIMIPIIASNIEYYSVMKLFLTKEEDISAFNTYIGTLSIALVLFVLLLLIELFYIVFGGAMYLMKSKAIKLSKTLYIIDLIIDFLSGSIWGIVVDIWILTKIGDIIPKISGGSEYEYHAKKEKEKQAAIDNDTTKWRCKSCGYINSSSVSECKSCGKYK